MNQKEDQHSDEGTRMTRTPIWTTDPCLDHVGEVMRRTTVNMIESLDIRADLVARGEWLDSEVLNQGARQVS